MSCFGGGRSRPWRWWRAKCAGIAASVGSRLRRSVRGLDGRKQRRPRATSTWSLHHHRRSFAPVYVDELYTHHHHHHHHRPTSTKPLIKLNAVAVHEEPSTGGKPRVAAGVGAMRNVLMRSPGRGGGVLGAVKGMGEVDLRAELFIRKFKEDMRLQSQRSAEEFQAMLARGL